MRWILISVIVLLYASLVGAFFAGFLYTPEGFRIPLYARCTIIVGLIASIVIPILVFIWWKALGLKGMIYSFLPTLALLGLLGIGYGAKMFHYYYSRVYPFDIFMQNNPALLTEGIKPKEEGVLRLLFLGGSTTGSRYLREEQRFPILVTKRLRERYPAIKFEMFNAGRAGLTSKHSLIHYVTYCSDWRPDIVIVMHGINDLYRSFTPPKYCLGPYNRLWSHFYGHDIHGAHPPSFERYLWEKYFGMYGFIWYGRQRYHQVDYPVEHYKSLPDFEEYLKKIVKAAHNDQADIVLATEPTLFKDQMTSEERSILGFASTYCYTEVNFLEREYPNPISMCRAMRAYNRAVEQAAQSSGAIFVDADAVVVKKRENFMDDVHITYPATDSVAQCIVNTIVEAGLIEKRGAPKAIR